MSVCSAFIYPHPPIILPQVGRGEERKIQKTIDACREISRRIAEIKPDTIILTSPHATIYADYFHISPGKRARGDLRQFSVDQVKVECEYDEELIRILEKEAQKGNIPAGTLGERDKALDHGSVIPLCFIQEVYKDFKMIRIGLSGLGPLEHYRFGKCIANAADKLGRRVVFIASGDLSHKLKEDGPYGYAEQGPEFDGVMIEAMKSADFYTLLNIEPEFCNAAGECGLRSFMIMAGALDGKAVVSELLSYEGTFGVGYAVASFRVAGEDQSRQFDRVYEIKKREELDRVKKTEDEYVKLARLSLEVYVKTGKKIRLPENLPEDMVRSKAGTFVSLKKHGHLRGCIGTISPVTNCIGEEIIRNAVSAGAEDPRFAPVCEAELSDLVYSVDILAAPEPIDSLQQLDVKRYGVIVTSGHKRGLLLPNLDGVDTPEQQVKIAMDKANIRVNEAYSLERFEVVRHK